MASSGRGWLWCPGGRRGPLWTPGNCELEIILNNYLSIRWWRRSLGDHPATHLSSTSLAEALRQHLCRAEVNTLVETCFVDSKPICHLQGNGYEILENKMEEIENHLSWIMTASKLIIIIGIIYTENWNYLYDLSIYSINKSYFCFYMTRVLNTQTFVILKLLYCRDCQR